MKLGQVVNIILSNFTTDAHNGADAASVVASSCGASATTHAYRPLCIMILATRCSLALFTKHMRLRAMAHSNSERQ
jgi:hypothetical protein